MTAYFQIEVNHPDVLMPLWVSPMLPEDAATALFELSAVGLGHELRLYYRGVLVRRRDLTGEHRVGVVTVEEGENEEAEVDAKTFTNLLV